MAGSFWENYGFRQSGIEKALEKENLTLEALLDEPELIQECKAGSQRLSTFLSQPAVLRQLLLYVTLRGPEPQASDSPEQARQRLTYPHVCCEVLACEIDAVLDGIVQDEELLRLLFDFLDRAPPLEPGGASFFARALASLFVGRTEATIKFVRDKHLLPKFFAHIYLHSFIDLLVTLVFGPPKRVAMVGALQVDAAPSAALFEPAAQQWLVDDGFVREALRHLDPATEKDDNAHENVSQLLCFVADNLPADKPHPLLAQLETAQTAQTLLGFYFAREARPNTMSSALSVLLQLLNRRVPPAPKQAKGGDKSDESKGEAGAAAGDGDFDGERKGDVPLAMGPKSEEPEAPREEVSGPLDPVSEAVCARMKELVGRLLEPPKADRIPLPAAMLNPPLGAARLKLVRLVLTLARVCHVKVNEALREHRVLAIVLDLALQFEWNSLLHGLVKRIVSLVLSSNSTTLKRALVGDARLAQWIIGAEARARAADRKRGPAGFLAHLVEIANFLEAAAAKDAEVKELLATAPEWAAFVGGPLHALNERYGEKICGGAPKRADPGMLVDLSAIMGDMAALGSLEQLQQLMMAAQAAGEAHFSDSDEEEEGGRPRKNKPEIEVMGVADDDEHDPDEHPFGEASGDSAQFDAVFDE